MSDLTTKDDILKLFEDYRKENGLPADAELELVFDPETGDFRPALKGTIEGECITCPCEKF